MSRSIFLMIWLHIYCKQMEVVCWWWKWAFQGRREVCGRWRRWCILGIRGIYILPHQGDQQLRREGQRRPTCNISAHLTTKKELNSNQSCSMSVLLVSSPYHLRALVELIGLGTSHFSGLENQVVVCGNLFKFDKASACINDLFVST